MGTNFWLILQSITRLLLAAITTKVIATYLSPTQYFAYSQIQSLLQILNTTSTSIATAKYSATVARSKSSEALTRTNNAVFSIATGLSAAQGIAIFALSTPILKYAKIDDYQWALLILPFAAWIYGIIAISQAVFTGLGNAKAFSKSTIIASLSAASITIAFTAIWGIKGAILSTLASSLITLIVLRLIFNTVNYKLVSIRKEDLINEVTKFAFYSLIIGIAQYSSHIYLKANFAQNSSINEAGLYSAASRISELYMGVLAVIYANKLINLLSTTSTTEIRSLIMKILMVIIPIFFIVFALVAFLSESIIPILLGSKYVDASIHLRYLIISDYLKCIYWVFAYFLISTKASQLFFIIEISGTIILVIAAITSERYTHEFNPQIGLIFQNFFLVIIGFASFWRLTKTN